jgi:hypothetical protein
VIVRGPPGIDKNAGPLVPTRAESGYRDRSVPSRAPYPPHRPEASAEDLLGRRLSRNRPVRKRLRLLDVAIAQQEKPKVNPAGHSAPKAE